MGLFPVVTALLAAGIWAGLTDSSRDFFAHAAGYWISTMVLTTLTEGYWKRVALLVVVAAIGAVVIQQDFDKTTIFTWQERIGAIDMDGTRSYSTGRGTGSHHGGVREWLYEDHHRPMTQEERWKSVLSDYWGFTPFAVAVPAILAFAFFNALSKRKELDSESSVPDRATGN